jgi:hypothetical protein
MASKRVFQTDSKVWAKFYENQAKTGYAQDDVINAGGYHVDKVIKLDEKSKPRKKRSPIKKNNTKVNDENGFLKTVKVRKNEKGSKL